MKTILYFKSIKNRLAFWFLMVALIPFVTLSISSYQHRVEEAQRREFDKIATIRDLKIKQITTWLYERFNDIKALAEDPEIRSLEGSEGMDLIKSIREYLKEYVALHKDYIDAYIINPVTGNIEIATIERLEGENRLNNPYLTEPLKSGELYVKDIFYSKNLDRISMTISTPVRCLRHQGQDICSILVLRINLDHTIYDLLRDFSGLGETGETMIFNKDLIALSELRAHPHAPLNLKIDTEATRLACQGKTGIIKSTDYTGKTVLAAYGYIPTTKWGFVAKQDLEEINAPAHKMLADFFLMLLIAVAGVFLLAVFLSRSISRPVLEMTAVSKKILEGDLSARNSIFHDDEFGFLSESFNRMADSLQSQIKVQQASSEISETIVKGQNILRFASELLKKLMQLTESDLSSFYVLNRTSARLEHLTSIGLIPEMIKDFDAENLEGEFGIVLATGNIAHIKDIPEDTVFRFRTFTGTLLPKEMLTIPIIVGEMVVAVISLASIRRYEKPTLELLNRSWVLGLNTAFSNLMANEETRRLAHELKHKNEELESHAGTLRAQTKELTQKSEVLHRQNVELEIRRKEVEEANRLKSQFLSNMSHELRTPLNSIMALSKVLILQTKQKISEEEISYLRIIERNGKNLLALINDILDLSKIEAGRVEVNPRVFSPRATVESIMEGLAPIAEEKGIQMDTEFAEGFPQIESDEARVEQILQNIIGNAVKFTDKGGITVSGRYDTEYVYIAVSDTGIGIPKEHHQLIFEEFRQVDGSSSRKFGGTGLGLAIALKSAKMIAGNISVESVSEKGSTFTVMLPIAWKGVEPLYETKQPRPHPVIRLERKTVLVIDDDPEAANLISSSLLREGYNTVSATSGREALKLAESYSPFAITLDILMPDMDGWEVLQTLKNNPHTKDIPIIIISITEDRETGIALGAMGYLIKPVNRDSLISEIRKIARPHRLASRQFSVMVVDDNPIDRNEMAKIIENDGMHTISAENGMQCIQIIKENIPDVLVLDLVMPQMDGFKVLDFVRSSPELKDIPVIIVTAKDLTDEDRNKLQGAVYSVLEKTTKTAKALIDEILKILEGL